MKIICLEGRTSHVYLIADKISSFSREPDSDFTDVYIVGDSNPYYVRESCEEILSILGAFLEEV